MDAKKLINEKVESIYDSRSIGDFLKKEETDQCQD